ncbi:MAG: hypothetical protein SGI72_06400, partial [Planctomycetota bacterium]|nr:hypothetical protein [Planctomycetota bacterium]
RGAQPRVTPIHHRALTLSLSLVLFALALVYSGFASFGTFASYDDEGYFQAALTLIRNGARPYDDVVLPYGPAWLAVREFTHDVLHVPTTTDGVRFATMAAWLAAAGLCAALTVRCIRERQARAPLAIVAFGYALVVLRTLANEPGHPQDVALMCTLLAVYAALGARDSLDPRPLALASTLACGATWALTALTKINVGLFVGLALAHDGFRARFLRIAVLVTGLVLPWILMRERIAEGEVLALALASNVAWWAGTRAHRRVPDGASIALDHVDERQPPALNRLIFGAAAGVCALAIVAWVSTYGTSLVALAEALILAPLRFTSEIDRPLSIPAFGAFSAVLSLASWIFVQRTRRTPSGVLKFAFSATASIFSITSPGIAIAIALPWTWVAIDGTRERALLVRLAALFPLQAFPVSGTQLSLGVLPLLIVSILVLEDGLAHIVGSHRRTTLRWCAAASALLVVALSGISARDEYLAREHLPLPGAERTRFDEIWGARQRCLAATLTASKASFVSVRGDHSMHAWSRQIPPSFVLQSHAFGVLSTKQQATLVDDCSSAARLLLLDQLGRWSAVERAAIPLLAYADSECVAAGRLRTDVICHRRGEEPPVWNECALLADRSRLELDMRMPADVAFSRVKRALVVDVERGLILADSSGRERALRVDVARGTLVLAEPLPNDRAAFSCVRLLDANGTRLVTLQVVVAVLE